MVLLCSLSAAPTKNTLNLQEPGFEIFKIAISSDSKYMAGVCSSGHVNGNIVLWNLSNGRIENILKTNINESINVVRFSLKNDGIIFAGSDENVKIWKFKDNVVINTPKIHPGFITSIAVSPCGNYIASGDSKSIVCIWNTSNYSLHKKYVIQNDLFINSMAFSPDGKILAIGGYSPRLHILDLETGNIRLSNPLYNKSNDMYTMCPIMCLAFTADGQYIVVGGWRDKLSILSFDKLNAIFDLDASRDDVFVESLLILPDNKMILSTDSDGFITIWDLINKKLLYSIKIIDRCISSTGVFRQGKEIYVCTCYENHSIALWKIDGGKLNLKYLLHPGL